MSVYSFENFNNIYIGQLNHKVLDLFITEAIFEIKKHPSTFVGDILVPIKLFLMSYRLADLIDRETSSEDVSTDEYDSDAME